MSIQLTLTLSGEAIAALAEAVAHRVAEATADHPSSRRYMTVEEAAEYLRWSPDRIYKLTATGGIPHRKHGRRVLLVRDEIDRWLDDAAYVGPRRAAPQVSRLVPHGL